MLNKEKQMKKVLLIMLLCVFSLVGCNKEKKLPTT